MEGGLISVRSDASQLLLFREPYCSRTFHLRGLTSCALRTSEEHVVHAGFGPEILNYNLLAIFRP